jgi:hypothetical protein
MESKAFDPSGGGQLAPRRSPALLATLRIDMAVLTGRK